jgi:hypothetical protein
MLKLWKGLRRHSIFTLVCFRTSELTRDRSALGNLLIAGCRVGDSAERCEVFFLADDQTPFIVDLWAKQNPVVHFSVEQDQLVLCHLDALMFKFYALAFLAFAFISGVKSSISA